MPEVYRVRAGDRLFSIAEKFGMDWKRIWEDGANADLRRRRGNPNILYAGDQLTIPDVEKGGEQGALEQPHKFRIKGKVLIRVVVYDQMHRPLSGVPYHFNVGGEDQPEKTTGSDGAAEVKVAKSVNEVELHLPWGSFPVMVGHLDPANTIRGAQQRLSGLGFNPGPHDGEMGPRTRRAIAAFQQAEAAVLQVNGSLDRETIKRLRALHDNESLPGAPEDWDGTPPERPTVDPLDEEANWSFETADLFPVDMVADDG
jgi:N-acetylmuramoyl-L-alanine amidase